MTYPQTNRQFQHVWPPRAYGATGPAGQVVVVPVSTVPGYLDLTSLTFGLVYNGQVADSSQGQGANFPGVQGDYVTIYADGADVGVIVSMTASAVSGGAAPVLANHGTVSGTGTYQGATGTCFRIPSGTSIRVHMDNARDLFLGYVGSATGTMRLYQSSNNPSTG